MFTIAVSVGALAAIAFGAALLLRSDPAGGEGAGRLIVTVALALIVGVAGYAVSLSIIVAQYQGSSPGAAIVRACLTLILCWMTFKGSAIAYWVLVGLFAIALGVSVPTTIQAVVEQGLAENWGIMVMISVWIASLVMITLVPEGRAFIMAQQAQRRERG